MNQIPFDMLIMKIITCGHILASYGYSDILKD